MAIKLSLSNNTSSEIKKMIDDLEYMNDEDVKTLYNVDTIEDAEKLLYEEYEEVVEQEEYYRGMDDFQFNGFASASDYYSFR